MPRSPRGWTPEEDRILLEKARKQLSNGKKTDTTVSWASVSNALPDRNNKDCRKRWFKLTGAKKGSWALSEDEKLLEGVQKYDRQWAMVAKTVETRNADQCAKRWQHCLDPSLDRSEWTDDKDAQFIAAVKRYGTNWKEIKKLEFPMRSTTNLKNRHVALFRQSNKTPSAYLNEGDGPVPSTDWLSIGREMSDNMIIDASEDGNYLQNDLESSGTSISTPSFENNLALECSPSASLVTERRPKTASSDPITTPWTGEFPSIQTSFNPQIHYYPPLDNFLGSTFDHATDLELEYDRDVNDCEPCIPEFPTHTMSSAFSQRANLDRSHNFEGMIYEEASHQESNQQPRNLASNVSSSVPQMTLTIDNPDPRTMTSILEVLTEAKSKVTLSMNP